MNGNPDLSVPGILNLRFQGKRADTLIAAWPGIAISAGSACFAKGVEPSYVLRALGLTTEEAHSSLRFSFGRFTTPEEIQFVIGLLKQSMLS